MVKNQKHASGENMLKGEFAIDDDGLTVVGAHWVNLITGATLAKRTNTMTGEHKATPDTKREARICVSCSEGESQNECPESKRACGHHCNHTWTHDSCCWCGQSFEPDNEKKEESNENS
jgi:hypothetical protein